MKKILLTIAVLLLIASAGYCQDQPLQRFDKSSPLTLTIKSDKQVYEVGEEINITYTLKNVSNKEILILAPFEGDIVVDNIDGSAAFDKWLKNASLTMKDAIIQGFGQSSEPGSILAVPLRPMK